MTKHIQTLIVGFALLCLYTIGFAQNTVGVLSYDPSQASDGYNLFFPHNQTTVYLFDNCGRVVHSWPDTAGIRPGNAVYLLENGHLVKCKRPASIAGNPIWAGGGGATVEIRDWDNNLLWTFTLNDSLRRLHHDVAPMPNGNILMIAWENKTAAEAVAVGRDTALIPEGELWPDYVIEVKPIGVDSFDIVWEWHAWDHLIQDYDSTKPSFGNPADFPELIDINFLGSTSGEADWMHVNAIDYNPTVDQIILSVPTFGEVWIIDHSTTTAQAASSSGGASGLGGDLMFRWGNPQAYRQGTAADQKLFYQHDAHWVRLGIPESDPEYDKISVFNNRVSGEHSTAHLISPNFNSYDWEYAKSGDTWEPSGFFWSFIDTPRTNMYSNILSSLQVLPNGNRLISTGRPGYSFEINADGEKVWEYKNPMVSGVIADQGDTLSLSSNLHFNMKRYPSTYKGFDNRDLTPGNFIENNSKAFHPACFATSIDGSPTLSTVQVYPNPASESLTIASEELVDQLTVHNTVGQEVHLPVFKPAKVQKLDLSSWAPGMYIITVNGQSIHKVVVE